jgi:hypothetical protein
MQRKMSPKRGPILEVLAENEADVFDAILPKGGLVLV